MSGLEMFGVVALILLVSPVIGMGSGLLATIAMEWHESRGFRRGRLAAWRRALRAERALLDTSKELRDTQRAIRDIDFLVVVDTGPVHVRLNRIGQITRQLGGSRLRPTGSGDRAR